MGSSYSFSTHTVAYQILAETESIGCHLLPKLIHNRLQGEYKVLILNFVHQLEKLCHTNPHSQNRHTEVKTAEQTNKNIIPTPDL